MKFLDRLACWLRGGHVWNVPTIDPYPYVCNRCGALKETGE